MDRLIYTAMTGAKAALDHQANVANNLANSVTTGFRSEMNRFRAVEVQSAALPTRAFAVDASVRSDFSVGPVRYTGNPTDVALAGAGWFAVQTSRGEAYTRAGDFHVDANGVLKTHGDLEVMGDAGPISIPPDNDIEIASDGTITATPRTGSRNAGSAVGRLKLVNPEESTLVRGDDGLFRTKNNAPAPMDENVRVSGRNLEGSNVNVVEQLVSMITVARQFEMHMQMLQNAQQNDQSATKMITA